ncbi:MAG TPA: undecaprenyldiphospho-muramoylpentapeptide beta-N-acetylglucosaminyltransferase [Acidobacteriota bacterium]|nr:undecaprenyldiphospho-muramoylpentapeptide beta-N-acetylglucosaminyltransferase [Acidobacteriota bacterium]
MRVLIADGGTGGHIFPAIAVADELKRRAVDAILFTGTKLGLEKDLVPRHGYELKLIRVGGLIGKGIFARIKTLLQLPVAYWQSRKIVSAFQPDVVIGFGAYASGPVLTAAHHKGVPTVIVEPNAVPGFTNRLASRFVDKVAVAFEDTGGVFRGKAVLTGTPIRAFKRQPIAHDRFTVGVYGGSQGSHALNQTILQALPALAQWRERFHLIHQTGKAEFESIKAVYDKTAPFYEATPFIHNVEDFYNKCDLLVCRAGAITLAEIMVVGKAAILVPLPTSTHGHQEQNARRLMEAGAAVMVLQSDFTENKMLSLFEEFMNNPAKLKAMETASLGMGKPEATKSVVDLAYSVANKS